MLLSTSRRTAAAVCLFSLALQGCYASVVAPRTGPMPSGDVHVILTPEGAQSMVAQLGPRAASLDGQLVERTDAGITLSVTKIARTTGTEEDWPSERLTVPVSAVQEVWTKRFSRTRSVLLAAAIGAAAVLAAKGIGANQSTGGSRPGEPGATK